jgi:hypothetical protein
VELPRDFLVREIRLLVDDLAHDRVLLGRNTRRVPAAERLGLERPVSRRRRFQRRTVASPILNSTAASSSVMPARSKAATTRSLRSTEYAHPIATSVANARWQQIKDARSRQLGSAVTSSL